MPGMGLTELATADVVTATPDTQIAELLGTMDDESIGSVVITDGEKPTGIVTDRMIAMACRDQESFSDMTAEDVMTTDLVTATEDHTHFEVLETMRDNGIRRIPIVDGDSLTGIVTLDDLIMVTATELNNASEVIEQQAGPR